MNAWITCHACGGMGTVLVGTSQGNKVQTCPRCKGRQGWEEKR